MPRLQAGQHGAAHCEAQKVWATTQPIGPPSQNFTHFGQQVDSDICTSFESSFPHGFVAMLNFKDRYSTEGSLYFLKSGNSAEICSSLDHFQEANASRLVDGKIGRWVTDNGRPFLSQETQELAETLAGDRGFSIPFDSDSLAVPERNWGVPERMMRSMHAAAADTNDPIDRATFSPTTQPAHSCLM